MTIREGLERLKEPYRSQAIENTSKVKLGEFASSCENAMWQAFDWGRTKQGIDYWINIHAHIEEYLEPSPNHNGLDITYTATDEIVEKLNNDNMNEMIINGVLYRKVEEEIKEKEIKCFEDLGDIEGEYVSSFSEISFILTTARNSERNTFPKGLAYPFGVVLPQLLQLRDRVRGDWKPDWKDGTLKYPIRFDVYNGLYIESVKVFPNTLSEWIRVSPHIFCFEKQEQAEKFLENHYELLKIYFEATC